MSAMISYAHNREDIVLWRALGHVEAGRYVEIRPNHPTLDSVSRLFYDHGWSGIIIEPSPEPLQLDHSERSRDAVVQGPYSATLLKETVTGEEIHFLRVPADGAQEVDVEAWRPWVLVITGAQPESATPSHRPWEQKLSAQRYQHCLFDGSSHFYVSARWAEELRSDLSYPATDGDDRRASPEARSQRELEDLRAQVTELMGQVTHWRSLALSGWSDAISRDLRQQKEIARQRAATKRLRSEVRKLRSSTSWRVTKPLRKAGSLVHRR